MHSWIILLLFEGDGAAGVSPGINIAAAHYFHPGARVATWIHPGGVQAFYFHPGVVAADEGQTT